MDNNTEEQLNPYRASFRKALRTALRRAVKKHEKLTASIEDCAKAEFYLECGEIIKANLALIKRGQKVASLPDMYNPGCEREIKLDENLKPLDNARKYFKKQRKLQKGEETIREQLEICEKEIAELEEIQNGYSAWEEESDPSLPPPPEFVDGARRHNILIAGLEPPKSPQQQKNELPRGVREFTSHDDIKILVGKNARDNDYLSMRVARGNDWWFHVAHVQGSHVVARSTINHKGNEPLPQETLLDAAHLAAYFSKARKATRVDVHYCQAKNIRKSRKAPPGQVTITNAGNINVRIEEDRLKRLLKGFAGDD